MNNKIATIAQDLLRINDDICCRFKHTDTSIDDFEFYDFDQTWGSTALGFGGIGGQMMTTARTYVFIPVTCDENAFVYFSGRFAYAVPWSSEFSKDVRNQRLRSVKESGYYIRCAKEQFTYDNDDYMK